MVYVGLGLAHPAAAAEEFTSQVTLKFNQNLGDNHPTSQSFVSPGAPGQPVSDTRDIVKSSAHGAILEAASGNAAGGRLGVSISGLGSVDAPHTQVDMSVQAISTLNDFLTIAPTATRPAGTVIHLVNNMNLSGASTSAFVAQPSTQGRPVNDYVDASTSVRLSVSGTGVAAGPDGLVLFSSLEGFSNDFFHFGPISEHSPQAEFVQIVMDVIVGQATPLSLTLSLSGANHIFSEDFLHNHPGSAQFNADFSHTLAWGADTVLTDPLTGEILQGLEITSASGFDYLHGGEPALPGAVPEPGAWALLILGFASVGAVLRRRTALTLIPTRQG